MPEREAGEGAPAQSSQSHFLFPRFSAWLRVLGLSWEMSLQNGRPGVENTLCEATEMFSKEAEVAEMRRKTETAEDDEAGPFVHLQGFRIREAKAEERHCARRFAADRAQTGGGTFWANVPRKLPGGSSITIGRLQSRSVEKATCVRPGGQ